MLEAFVRAVSEYDWSWLILALMDLWAGMIKGLNKWLMVFSAVYDMLEKKHITGNPMNKEDFWRPFCTGER